MARIFITGSADGLGMLAARSLVNSGHKVVLHARNETRAKQTLEKVPGAETILTADLACMSETKELASEVNALGKFDAIIHNAGVYNVSGSSPDGLPLVFAVNTIAPYILTCLIEKPKRLIYLSSDMHLGADPKLGNLSGEKISKNISYSDTKFHDLILAMTVAERWKDVYSNAINPGWVPTKMGGASAPDNLEKGYQTQVWLAESNDKDALVSGQYFYHKRQSRFLQTARDVAIQKRLFEICERITGLSFE